MWAMCLLILTLLLTSCAQLLQGDRATWDEERWGEIVPQELDNSCGFSSLLTIMRYHFGDERFDERALFATYIKQASVEQLKRALDDGASLPELGALADSLGYIVRQHMFTLEELEHIVSFVPVLVYLEIGRFRHFAVVRGMNKEVVWLADPARGNVYHTRKSFLAEWRTPEAFRDRWTHPGGLIIIRPEGEGTFRLSLLKEPTLGFPSSFHELRRQMIMEK